MTEAEWALVGFWILVGFLIGWLGKSFQAENDEKRDAQQRLKDWENFCRTHNISEKHQKNKRKSNF